MYYLISCQNQPSLVQQQVSLPTLFSVLFNILCLKKSSFTNIDIRPNKNQSLSSNFLSFFHLPLSSTHDPSLYIFKHTLARLQSKAPFILYCIAGLIIQVYCHRYCKFHNREHNHYLFLIIQCMFGCKKVWTENTMQLLTNPFLIRITTIQDSLSNTDNKAHAYKYG